MSRVKFNIYCTKDYILKIEGEFSLRIELLEETSIRWKEKYKEYRKITSLHSKKFDSDERNQGDQYKKIPLDISTFSWE